jgi:hypothetical protein
VPVAALGAHSGFRVAHGNDFLVAKIPHAQGRVGRAERQARGGNLPGVIGMKARKFTAVAVA